MPFTAAALATSVASGAPIVGGSLVLPGLSAGMLAADIGLTGAGLSAYGTYQQGQYAEDIAKYNAKVYADEAASAEKAGEYETREERIEKRRLLARQLVSFAGGGVVPGTGTPLKIMSATGAEMERDIGLTQYEYGLAGSRARSKARYARYIGKTRKRAAMWQTGTTVMTGASRFLDYRYNV